MTLNKRDRKQFERLSILELAMKGHTYREISARLGVSLGHISNVLHGIAVEAREQIEQRWFLETIPYQTFLSLTKLDAMDKVAWHIVDTSKDERCRMQALSCLAVQDARRRDLLLSTEVIDRAISAQRTALITKEVDAIKNASVSALTTVTVTNDGKKELEQTNGTITHKQSSDNPTPYVDVNDSRISKTDSPSTIMHRQEGSDS